MRRGVPSGRRRGRACDGSACSAMAGCAGVLLAAMLLQFAPPTSGAPPSEPSLVPGTTWKYRYTVTRPSQAPRVGTRTYTYGGPTTYRSKTYYYYDTSDTLTPGQVIRDYFVWKDGHLWQTAEENHSPQGRTIEFVFDRGLPVDVPETVSGRAQFFQDGAYQGEMQWVIELTLVGPSTVTVPAGTFAAKRWALKFQLGPTEQDQTVDSAGFADVREETRHYTDGTLMLTELEELVSGPVR